MNIVFKNRLFIYKTNPTDTHKNESRLYKWTTAREQLLEDALDMRTQQLFHLQKALVLHSGGGEGENGEGGADQLLSQASGVLPYTFPFM